MLETKLSQLAVDLREILRRHGPVVRFVKVHLTDGQSITVWGDGGLTVLPIPTKPPCGPAEYMNND